MAEPILECPCGSAHPLHEIVVQLIGHPDELVTVQTPDGSWRVPRIYIAAHGIAGVEVRTLAEIYKWERVVQ